MLRFCAAAIALLTMATSLNGADAQERRRTTPISPLALVLAPPPPNTAPLTVTSPDFENFGPLERVFMQPDAGGENRAPGLAWSEGPAGTQSYVMISEGVGEHRPDPTVHWIVYDIPADAHALPQGIPTDPIIANPAGAMNGLEATGTPGYRGTDTPEGAIHPYYFQVFALDTKLGLDPAQADRNTVIDAMKGHVLAAGQIVVVHNNR